MTGFREISIKLPTDYTEEVLRSHVKRMLGIGTFSTEVRSKSLDARKKSNIHWVIRVAVYSPELPDPIPPVEPPLVVPYEKRNKSVLVAGTGPAGLFSALILQEAGFDVTLIDRGTDVDTRESEIAAFEAGGPFSPKSNYAFGEGGAGTFSDGKLTSRTKRISKEKAYILDAYVSAGAPPEIQYLAHPHLGTDHLRQIAKNLRHRFERSGGTILFDCLLTGFEYKNSRVISAQTTSGAFAADYLIVAPGHSAYDTYEMLMANGVMFRTKKFAIGCRVEHPQYLINKAQWGMADLPGVKAAEYRLTSKADGNHPVYTFCMCPGGVVVPAQAYGETSIVNGMSFYQRDGGYANAACVAGVSLSDILKRDVSASYALNWLNELEHRFFEVSGSYAALACKISDFIGKSDPSDLPETSYPFGLSAFPLWELFPDTVAESLAIGLSDFSRKLNGFDSGTIMGLESKTSSPVQVIRDSNRACEGFDNLFLAGEGSGFAGGIISSAADGIKCAQSILGLR